MILLDHGSNLFLPDIMLLYTKTQKILLLLHLYLLSMLPSLLIFMQDFHVINFSWEYLSMGISMEPYHQEKIEDYILHGMTNQRVVGHQVLLIMMIFGIIIYQVEIGSIIMTHHPKYLGFILKAYNNLYLLMMQGLLQKKLITSKNKI